MDIEFKILMKNDNIGVHINSKDISWDVMGGHAKREYLVWAENGDKIMNSIDRAEIIIIKKRKNIKFIK